MTTEIITNDNVARHAGAAAGRDASAALSDFVISELSKKFDGKNPGEVNKPEGVAKNGGAKPPASGEQLKDPADGCLPKLEFQGSDNQPMYHRSEESGLSGSTESAGKKRFHQDNELKKTESVSEPQPQHDHPHMVHPYGSGQGLNGERLPNWRGL